MKIRKNDTVKILSGQHKGKTAKVLEVLPDEDKVRLEGLGTVKKHLKPNRSQKNPQGGIVEMAAKIHISKVMLVTPKSGTPTRVGFRITDDGKKLRVARGKKSKQEAID